MNWIRLISAILLGTAVFGIMFYVIEYGVNKSEMPHQTTTTSESSLVTTTSTTTTNTTTNGLPPIPPVLPGPLY